MTAILSTSQAARVDFTWLELTNQCNLHCVHCYAESSPQGGDDDLLTESDYLNLLQDIQDLGCRGVQFIGGEPTLNRSLKRLIHRASELGFSLIEVFTNLIQLPQDLLDTFVECQVAVATSFYSHDAAVHDAITMHPGSFERTVSNMRRILDANLRLRAGIIVMDQNRPHVTQTEEYLRELGVVDVGTDRLREFGRASDESTPEMTELCGNCAGGTLSISPSGIVSPCIMSKEWAVGSVLESPLTDLVGSDRLSSVREQIYDRVVKPRKDGLDVFACTPDRPGSCNPDHGSTCYPCSPNTNCGPNDCRPKH